MTGIDDLRCPLTFRPIYQVLVWGGRRLDAWRDDLPDGPVGESWELSTQPRGLSVVEQGPLAGMSLVDLTRDWGRDLVGPAFAGGDFPLLVKIINAADRLSVQVHPDDVLAQKLGVGERGKTECWLLLGDGGELFHGVKPGTTQREFESALAVDAIADRLNHFTTCDGDFFYMPARTVHALGAGCLLVEVQQSCDVTFRVYDWGRVGLDGRPRPTQVAESLQTIDFAAGESGPRRVAPEPHPAGGTVRDLVRCAYFEVEERRAASTAGGDHERCSIVCCLAGEGVLHAGDGEVALAAMRTYLVPACAGAWSATATADELRLLVSRPVL